MTGTRGIGVVPAAAVLLLLCAGASAADLGIPRDGLDRVLLDDGRVVEARVLPREGSVVPLEFPAGTIRVPKERVRETRLWRDFDPAPRDDAEKEKIAEGYVRFEGRLVTPERAEKLRREEVAEERERRKEAESALEWSRRRCRQVGKFDLWSNVPEEEFGFWGEALEELSKSMLKNLKGGDYRWTRVVVHIYRDKASFAEQLRADRSFRRIGRDFPSPDDPDQRVDVVLEGVDPGRRMPLVLGLSAIKLFYEMMGWQVDDLGGWVRCGVPLYFASASFEKGKLRTGLVDDLFLLEFRQMVRTGSLPSIDSVLRAGNEYWAKIRGDRSRDVVLGRFSTAFERQHVPYSWLLVHFLLHGERGKYRGGLTNWLRFWMTAKIGSKRSAHSMTWEGQKALFLKYLKLKDLEPLEEALRAYAEELEYRMPSTYLILADKKKEQGDAEEALAHVEKAVALAGESAAALLRAGEVCAGIEGGKARAVEILRTSVELDPLAPETRDDLAKLLEGEEADRERRLAESLRGVK